MIIASLFYSTYALAFTSSTPIPLSRYYQDHWTTQEGLPQNTINDIAQTPEGYLWIATWEGVARYNGREFKVFSRATDSGLPDSGIRDLVVSDEGLLALDSRGGISRYQQQHFIPQADVGVMINDVLHDSQGLTWLATEGDGLYLRKDDSTELHIKSEDGLASNYVYRLVEDERGHIWVATAKGLAKVVGRQLKPVAQVPNVSIGALLKDNQGRILIGSEQGVYIADDQDITPFHPAAIPDSIISMLQDNSGALWLGTVDSGLIRVSELGIERLDVAQGLPEQYVPSLLQDKEGSIWVGTNGGLMRLREVSFININEQDGLAGNYARTLLAHSDGSVWVGSSTGLSRISSSGIEALALTIPDSTAPSVLSLAQGPEDELWVGTFSHGLLHVKDKQVIAVYGQEQGLPANKIRAILPAADGSLWLGTSLGLSQFKNGTFTNFTTANGLPNDVIMSLHQADNGDIWVGTPLGAAIIRNQTITEVDLSAQEKAEFVFGFYSEPGSEYLWLGTDRGLVRYRTQDNSVALVGIAQGLPLEKIFQPVADGKGSLWLPTNKGVTRVSLAEAHRVADGKKKAIKFTHYGEKDGLTSSQTYSGASNNAVMDNAGNIWLTTALGMMYTQPNWHTLTSSSDLPVVLETFMVGGEAQVIKDKTVLDAGTSRIQFNYAGLGYVVPERIQYRTLLVGFDKDWVNRGQQAIAEYTNLAPGHYVFKVAARYSYQDWGPPTQVSFTILPFIWQLPFFWSILACLLVISLWLLMRMRLRFIRYHAQELERQVADKTQELKHQAQAFARQARADSLTGLPNRRAFDEAMASAFSRAERTPLPITLVVLDIDHFKLVNDTWSHEVGDQVLKVVAELIRNEIREVDFPARWGGEEFTILLPNTDLMTSVLVAERLRESVMEHDFGYLAADFKLTVSIGLAEAAPGMDAVQLLANADVALYQAKGQGRNRVVTFMTEPTTMSQSSVNE
ncbi:ligand-binding sensor domain-containing diguanylate cyclase [Oceanisphaera avium]|uniref:ligand-binding sensor domain-containing diguanylate cyclase n=1 Tax=Oceanisphaera avium TaxID=1903694 RepID=UPI0018DF1064|nr:ligand-binding sensor domain-containing diguanylate cyclase [Oceanisphaera avium]